MYLCYVVQCHAVPCHAMKRVSSLPVFFLSGTLFHSGSLPAARFYEYRRGRATVQMGDPIWTTRKAFLGKNKNKNHLSCTTHFHLNNRENPLFFKKEKLKIICYPSRPTYPLTNPPTDPLTTLTPCVAWFQAPRQAASQKWAVSGVWPHLLITASLE